MKSNTALDVSNLCQSCGLCCDGTIYSHVRIDQQEKEPLEKLGFRFHERNKKTIVFDLPCSHLEDAKCTVYSRRPQKCIGYFCRLAKKVINGSASFSFAASCVEQTRQEADWLRKNAVVPEADKRRNMGLRDFLSAFQKQALRNAMNGNISTIDIDYSKRAFEFIKLIDRNIYETSLLSSYAILMQTIHFNMKEDDE